jgi:hypothetical protein
VAKFLFSILAAMSWACQRARCQSRGRLPIVGSTVCVVGASAGNGEFLAILVPRIHRHKCRLRVKVGQLHPGSPPAAACRNSVKRARSPLVESFTT